MRKMLALVVMVALATACKKDEKATGGSAPSTEEGKPPETAGATTPTPEAKAPAGDGLKMTHKPAAVGDKREETDSLTTEFTLTPPGKPAVAMTMKQEENRHVEILAVSGENATKVKVHYAVKTDSRDMGPGGKKEKVSPLQGKAYIVWEEAGAIKATADGGGAISKEEEAELVKDWTGDLGEDEMDKLFRDKVWKIDEKVALTPDQLASFNKKNEQTSAKGGSITLTGVDGNLATFAVEMDVEQREAKGTLRMPMKMTARIDTTTSRPQAVDMTGTIDGQMQGMEAKGTLQGKKTYKY